MKKGILVSILLLCIALLTVSVSASSYVLSSEYTDNTSCQNDVTKYNVDFPDYVRSSCFINNGKYYYKICPKGNTCTDSNTSTSTNQNTTSIQSTYQSGSTNTYSDALSSSLKTKIDQKIITVLKNAKNTYSKNEYKVILTNFLTKLSGLETRYNSNTTIKNLVGYIKFEVEKILFELEEDKVDDFICELMGNCDTATSNTTTANVTLSITINQGIFYCGDPNKNDYTTYSPINKIVLLNNDIITRCTTKGGKAWTKSASGTIENLKNISDVKNGDVFTTGSTTSNTTNTNNTTTVSTTNVCGTGKKKVGSVCVTDTASVNTGGNYTLGKGACVSHIGTDVGYDGSSYTNGINGQTHGIGKTLNQCIEACDIGDINIGLNKASCFYEGKVIRSAGSSTITNITSGTIINSGTTTTTNTSTSTTATKLSLMTDKTSAQVGDTVNLSYDIGTNYSVCTAHISYGTTGSATLGSSNQLYNKYNGPTAATGTRAISITANNVQNGKVTLYFSCYNTTTQTNDAKNIVINIGTTSTSTSGTTSETCIATTINGYTLPAAGNGQVTVISKVVSGANYSQEFKCDGSGWYARGTETSTSTSTSTSTAATKLSFTLDKTRAKVGDTITISYDIGTNYSVCSYYYGENSSINSESYINGSGKENLVVYTSSVNNGKASIVYHCMNTKTQLNELIPLSIDIDPTYTQEQVNAAVLEIINVHGTGVEGVKVLVAGILKLEAAGAVGLRQQVATYLKTTLDQVNAAVNTYK